MLVSWPNLLMHELLGVMLGWLLLEIWQQWRAVRTFEQRWPRELAASDDEKPLPRAGHYPAWLDDRCVPSAKQTKRKKKRHQTHRHVGQGRSVAGGRRSGQPGNIVTIRSASQYYGWPGLGNLRANGYPNGGRWRQWHWRACRQFFIETRGTPLYRRPVAPKLIHQVLTPLAEALSLEATARLFEVEPETVAQWLALAANHFEALSAYLS
jgi:hypothetical protein